jgi:hypothetical protein
VQVSLALTPYGETGMDDKFRRLSELGAGEFEHLNGSLIEHLQGTRKILDEWAASTVLKDAGLYHAAYGTAGFDENLVSTSKRNEISKIIGPKAEEIVYQYCACDRKYFFPQIGVSNSPQFKNQFNGEIYHLSASILKHFCELTAANETEIAIGNPDFIADHGKDLSDLFIKMSSYLSEAAKAKADLVFGGVNA